MNSRLILVVALWLGQTWNQAATPAASIQEKPAPLDRDPHLIGWWKLDEVSGTNAADASPQGHRGTLLGGLCFEKNSVPGRIGNALKLNGGDGFLQTTGFKGLVGPQARTVTAWIKTTSTSGELVCWGTNDFGKMFIFGFVRARIGVVPKGGYLYMKASVHDDAWHHVAVTVEAADPPNLHDHVKLYRDGVQAEIDDIGLLDLWPIDTGSGIDVRIGYRFKGCLDDVRLYDRALSEDEVKSLYQSALADGSNSSR